MDTTEKQQQFQKQKFNLPIKKSTIWTFLSLFFFKIVLDLSCYFVVPFIWGYGGLQLHFSVAKLLESYFLLFVVFSLAPKLPKKLSDIIVWLLILLSYVPMLTLFALKDESRMFMYAVTAFWAMVFFLLRLPKIFLPSLKQKKIIRILLFFLLITTVFLMVYNYFGFSLNFDFTQVYKIRSQYVEMGIPFAGYLFNWVAYIIGPALLAIFITQRRWFPAALIIALQALLFSATGNKTYFFALPFALVLMWVIVRKNPVTLIAIGLAGIVLLGMFSYWLANDVWISSLFTRRTLLVPAQLSFFYYNFFTENSYVFLSHSILKPFLDYPFGLNPPHLIGEAYFENSKMGANTGIVGDAYMNFGFLGLILWGILLAVILKLIDACSDKKNIKIAIAIVAMPVISLTNSALLTNFLTHGLLLALILLYLLPKNIDNKT